MDHILVGVMVHQGAVVHAARRVHHVARQQGALVQVRAGSGHSDGLLGGAVELYHHGRVHFGPVHVVNALHVQEILVLALDAEHWLVSILITQLVVQVLVNWNVLQMVLVLFLAAQSQLSALVKLVSVAFSRNVHHNEVLTQLVLVRVVHSDRVVIHLAVVLHCCQDRSVV